MIPALLALSATGAVLALMHPAPSARMEELPRAIVDLQRPVSRR